jgi:hypothetical protein
MNNSRIDLNNCSTAKPPLSTTLIIDTIESSGELEPNIKLLLIHMPFILHNAMMGIFSLLPLAL